MKLHRSRTLFGAPFAVMLLIVLTPLSSPGQVLPRRQRTPADRSDEKKPADQRTPARPLLSPFQGEGQLVQPDEGGPRDPLSGLFEDALETPIDGDRYRLGPGDQLSIGIMARTPAAYPASVGPDGSLFLPLAGEVHVGGMTLNEARAAIQRQQERIRRKGTFTTSIRLTRLRRLKVQVLGEVEKPATYLVGSLTRVVEAIARAGGLTPIASRRHVRITRQSEPPAAAPSAGSGLWALGSGPGTGGRPRTEGPRGSPGSSASEPGAQSPEPRAQSPEPRFQAQSPEPRARSRAGGAATGGTVFEIDLEEILLRGDPSQNVLLETGDVIYIPRARQIVNVSGEVNRPGDYECDPGDNVAALLERAGGVRAQGAVSAVQVERPEAGDRRRLLVADLGADGGLVKLQDRDRVVVPKLTTMQGRLRIIGAVKGSGDNWQPDTDAAVPRTLDIVSGIYLLRKGDRVRDVLENMGGATAKADVTRAAIERPDGAGGKTRIPVNLYRALVLQDPEQNVELRDGDTLLVPKIQDKVYVIGEVPRQGEQDYIEGKTVLDYVSMAGGPGSRAKRQETVIVRTEGAEPKIIKVGLDRFLSGKKLPRELAIQPGDLIVVPQAAVRGWQEFAQIFFTLRSLTTGLFLFR